MALLTSNISFFPHDKGVEVHLLNMHREPRELIFVGVEYAQMSAGFQRYNDGAMIQSAFPFLNASQREFLMTGLSDEEWNEMFKDVEGDEVL